MLPSILILSTAHGMGTGAYVVLENLLRAWRSDKVCLHVLTPADSRIGLACRDNGIAWTDWATPTDSLTANGRALFRLRSLPRPSLVHAWHSRGMEWAAVLGRQYRCATAATLHDHPDASTHGSLRRGIMAWSVGRFDALAAVSKATATAWRERRCATPMTIIHNGVPDLSAWRRRTGVEPVAGFAGMYNPVKGFATLQQWIAATADLPLRWKLYGDVAPSLQDATEKLVASSWGRVTREGFKPTAEIFAEIDFLVHPSSEFDPFPTALLEAMSASIPAVATDVGGSREIVVDGTTGFLVPDGLGELGIQHIRDLAQDPSLRSRLGAAARERFLQDFQPGRMVKGYESFWIDLLDARTRTNNA